MFNRLSSTRYLAMFASTSDMFKIISSLSTWVLHVEYPKLNSECFRMDPSISRIFSKVYSLAQTSTNEELEGG